MPTSEDVTQLLIDWTNGDEAALQKLIPLVYDELHRLAHRYMRREAADHVLQTSALVNEAYLRLVNQKKTRWQNRAQFFGVAAQLMRRILVDYARKQNNLKRGGEAQRVTLDAASLALHEQAADVLALNEALQSLTEIDRRQGQLVELRFFGGLTIEETAEVMELSPGTVMREWTFAKAWLCKRMSHTS
ncbi:MAG: sigma-70 family RNA polymerase sigma factor [Acidobacteriota bacterium]